MTDFEEVPRLNDCLDRLVQMALILTVSLLTYFEDKAAIELIVMVAFMS